MLEVVLHVGLVGRPVHLHHELVERVVVTAPQGGWPPAVASLHAAAYAHGLGETAKLLPLVFILELEE